MKIISTVRVSVKGLTANKLRTFFMMLGVFIGIAALTIIISVGQGAKRQVMQRMESLSAFGAVMVIPGGGMTRGLGSRSEERRVGKECSEPCRCRGWPGW